MESIWYQPSTVEMLNDFAKNTMIDFLGIVFTEIGDNYLKATMPLTPKTSQPMSIMHGGANVVLAETLASAAGNAVVDYKTHYVVGLDINANHLRAVSNGLVTGIAEPIHLGASTQVWTINIYTEQGKLSCVSRMTAAVIRRT